MIIPNNSNYLYRCGGKNFEPGASFAKISSKSVKKPGKKDYVWHKC